MNIVFVAFISILWVGTIIDLFKSRSEGRAISIVWVFVILFFPILGSVFYFKMKRRPLRYKEKRFQPKFN
ncbi:PLDc N-terminal domain-containing protein [Limibacter armeniacum]|uniref:PLDc N-terminal domain-containing protein n=1 Tax=Limibacter armeniacum TaxID=466084 RepID=UPI0038CBFED5